MPDERTKLVDRLFRSEAGKLHATLTRILGIRNVDLAEDVVQETMLRALKQWSFGVVPENPSAWLMQVAKNQAFDILRRHSTAKEKEDELEIEFEERQRDSQPAELFSEKEIKDDQLRMIFACCHPKLPIESQVALTLRTMCGLSIGEIARALLTTDQNITKRLTRAKRSFRKGDIPFEIPSGKQLEERLNSVLNVLYLLFNEGYNASHGLELIRVDLCEEAIRLTTLLVEHPSGDIPTSHSLLALMFFQTARFPARTSNDGSILLLQYQDRSLWDSALINMGLCHLKLAARGNEMSCFHLQAGIAATHVLAASYESTDWKRVLYLYDLLLEITPTPVVALNRAVAVSKIHGAEAGLKALDSIRSAKSIDSYYLFHAVRGEFHAELKAFGKAIAHYKKAIQLTKIPSEKAFLSARLKSSVQQIANERRQH